LINHADPNKMKTVFPLLFSHASRSSFCASNQKLDIIINGKTRQQAYFFHGPAFLNILSYRFSYKNRGKSSIRRGQQ